jgi:hypothetical protein
MDEFAVAMYLIYAKMAGKDLPVTLPAELVPPSTRDLDALASMVKMGVISNLNAPKRAISRDYSAANIGLSPASEMSRETNSSPLQSIPTQDHLDRKEKLLKIIGTKRAQLADLQEKAEEQSRESRKVEAEFLSTKREVSSIHEDIVQSSRVIEQYRMSIDKARSFAIQSGGATSSQLKTAALKLEKDIFESLEKASKMIDIKAETEIEDVKRKHPSQGSSSLPANVDSVSSKAAAMLAARMAALGVGALKTTSQGNYQVEINRINEEKKIQQSLLRDREIRIKKILADIQVLVGSNNVEVGGRSPAWSPKMDDQVKFEDGIGIQNSDVRELILNLKDVTMNAKRNGPLPVIPIKQPQMSYPVESLVESSKPLFANDSVPKHSVLKSEGLADSITPPLFPPSVSNSNPLFQPSSLKPQHLNEAEATFLDDAPRKTFEAKVYMPEREPEPLVRTGNTQKTTSTSMTTSISSEKHRSSFEIKHADMLQKAQEALKIAQEGAARRESSRSSSRTSISRFDGASDLLPDSSLENKHGSNKSINNRSQSISSISSSNHMDKKSSLSDISTTILSSFSERLGGGSSSSSASVRGSISPGKIQVDLKTAPMSSDVSNLTSFRSNLASDKNGTLDLDIVKGEIIFETQHDRAHPIHSQNVDSENVYQNSDATPFSHSSLQQSIGMKPEELFKVLNITS